MVWTGKRVIAIGIMACVACLWTAQMARAADETTTPPAQAATKEGPSHEAGQATSETEAAASGESAAHEDGVLHVELKFDRKVAIATNLILMWIGLLGLICILLLKIKEVDRVLKLKYEKNPGVSQ
jgi:hypothetical protein